MIAGRHRALVRVLLSAALATAAMACKPAVTPASEGPSSTTTSTAALAASDNGLRPWPSIRSWAYWLDSPSVDQLARTRYELLVTDELSSSQIARLRAGACRPRLVGYLSIGEAEDYRWYWQDAWRPGSPSWLLEENEDWDGNHRVEFWNPAWQRIVLTSLDRLVDLGYDGVYLDIVDAYEDQGHRAEMAAFVRAIASRARSRSPLGADFGVFVQNAESLAAQPDVVGHLTGMAREETYVWATDDPVPSSERRSIEADLDRVLAGSQGHLVLTVDYASDAALARDAESSSRARGYLPYVTGVDLDALSTRAAAACS